MKRTKSYSQYVSVMALYLTFFIYTQPAHSASGLYDFATQYPGFGKTLDTISQPVTTPLKIIPENNLSNSDPIQSDTFFSAENPTENENNLSGFYFGSRLLASAAQIYNENLSNGRGYEFHKNGEELDTTFGLGVLIGYDWEKEYPIRTELEYAYRFRNDFDTEEVGPWVNSTTKLKDIGYKNNLSTHSLILSIFYDFETSSKWKPYAGAGLGWARNSSTTTRKPNDDSEVKQTIETDTDNLAYSLQTGMRVNISSQWVGDIGYRFVDFGTIESGVFSGGDHVTADHLFSHDIILGVSYLY